MFIIHYDPIFRNRLNFTNRIAGRCFRLLVALLLPLRSLKQNHNGKPPPKLLFSAWTGTSSLNAVFWPFFYIKLLAFMSLTLG